MNMIINTFSWNEAKSSHRLMIVIVLMLGLINFFWGEKVTAGSGFGWDGVNYANMVRHLDSMIGGGQLSGYYTQRILPSAIVRSMMLLSGTAMSDINIIRSFELYNLVLLVGACFVWKRISDYFSLSLSGRWLGFSGIFINFECSKQAFYYPVLTDVTALFVAMLMLLFYVEKKAIPLLLATIIGAFCWPVVSFCGALLLIFLRTELSKDIIEPEPSMFRIKSFTVPSLVKFGGLAVLVLSIAGYIVLSQLGPVSEHACNGFNNELKNFASEMQPCALERLIPILERLLTGLPSLFGVAVALAMLVGSVSFFHAVFSSFRRVRLPMVALTIAAVLIPAFIVKMVANPSIANANSLQVMFKIILLPQEGKFLLPIVTLAVFWGPVVLLLLLFWQAFCVEARKLGPGIVAIIGISLLLGMANEPRFLTIGWPFIVLSMVLVLETSIVRPSFKYIFIFITVLYAQFWIRLNYLPWLGGDFDGLDGFPKQLYFMHYGLWMSWWPYLLQLLSLIVSGVLLKKNIIKVGSN